MGDEAQMAKRLSDKPRMKQFTQGMLSFQHPETQSSEAVGEVKTTEDIHARYLIYSISYYKFNKP